MRKRDAKRRLDAAVRAEKRARGVVDRAEREGATGDDVGRDGDEDGEHGVVGEGEEGDKGAWAVSPPVRPRARSTAHNQALLPAGRLRLSGWWRLRLGCHARLFTAATAPE